MLCLHLETGFSHGRSQLRPSLVRRLAASYACLAMSIAASTAVHAITFDINYISGNSTAPADDANGMLLTDVVEAAASRWSDIIEDSWTMKINIWYDTPAVVGSTAFAQIVTPNADDTRTIEGNIVFNNAPSTPGPNPTLLDYYYDPTPTNDEEFDLEQTLYGDLSPTEQALQYNATAPTNLLEEGFGGFALAGSDAAGKIDVFSTALHELGHHLGVTNQLAKAVDEWQNDSDYDLPPSLLAGRIMAVRADDTQGHLEPDTDPTNPVIRGDKLLQPLIPVGYRRLPSATDVLAAARVGGWTQIDLSRQDLLSGANWNNAANWEGGQLPGGADDAFVRLGGTIDLDVNEVVRSLFVGNGTVLRTGANRIIAADTITVDFDGTFPFARLVVESGGTAAAQLLQIQGGQLDMEGGLADVQTLVVNPVGTVGSLVGYGTVDVGVSLTNNGLISAGNGERLTIQSSNPGVQFDLDGDAGDGVVRAQFGNLEFAANVETSFGGRMEIGPYELEIPNAWTLQQAGTITLDGTDANFAVLRSGEVTIAGTVDVDRNGGLFAPVAFTQLADVNIPDANDTLEVGLQPLQTITLAGGSISGDGQMNVNGTIEVPVSASPVVDVNTAVRGPLNVDGVLIMQRDLHLFPQSSTNLASGGALELHGETTFDGGSFTGDGVVLVNDVARIAATTTVDINGTFDLDGQANNSELVVEDGQLFDLRASSIDFGDNQYDGSITLTNGGLGVDVDANVWTMAGSLAMTGFSGGSVLFAGDSIDFTGDLTASGPTQTIATPTRMLAGSTTSVAFGTLLQYNAPVTFDGGSHSIVGEVAIADSATINGGSLTAIEMEVGGGATLTINGGNTTVNAFTNLAGGAFDFNGGNFRISTGDAAFNSSLPFGGPTLGGQPTLIVENGADASTRATLIGNAAGEFGAAIVRGTNSNGSRRSTLRSTSTGDDLRVGQGGTGTLLIEDGGLVSFGDDTEIARALTESQGTVTVRGVANAGGNLIRSELDVTRNGAGSNLLVGRAGNGALHIEDGGLVRVGGSVSVAALAGSQGRLDVGGSSQGLSAELDAVGSINVASGGLGVVNLGEGGRITADTLELRSENATVNLAGGLLDVVELNLNEPGSTFNMTGGRLEAATIFGNFTQNGGTLAPGDSPGASLIAGNYDQSAGGRLEVELAGLILGSEFDHLEVDDIALLGGGLDVLLAGGFAPSLGDTFQILRATSVLDVFTSVNLPDVGDLAWAINYNPSDVVLEVVLPVSADVDGDFDVDGADFLAIQQSDTSLIPTWEQNFGASDNALPKTSAIPEPETAAMLLTLAIVVGVRRASRDRQNRGPRRRFFPATSGRFRSVRPATTYQALSTILAASVLAISSAGVQAVNLTVVYTGTPSIAHPNDPTGEKLVAITEAAASYWTAAFGDEHNMEVRVRYAPGNGIPLQGALAVAPIVDDDEDERRTVIGDLIVSNTAPFYFDDAPLDNVEYDLSQSVARELQSFELDPIYNVTSLQPSLEIGYSGTSNGTAPAAAGIDLLSTLAHELGHHFGITNQLPGAVAIWDPEDQYPLDPAQLGGRQMAVRTGDQFGHFRGSAIVHNLMQSGTPAGMRRLPTATDILAAAAASGWSQVDLPRRNYLGGADLNTSANWTGTDLPDANNGAFIRKLAETGPGNFVSASLSADMSLADLHILEGSQIATTTHKFTVAGDTLIDPRGETLQTRLNVHAGGELETNNLEVKRGGFLVIGTALSGGQVTVHDTLTIESGGSDSFVIGQGEISVGERLNNNGVLQTSGNLTLATSNASGNVWNLGGVAGEGRVSVTGGNLTVQGSVPSFNGSLTAGSLRVVDFQDGWTIGLTGELNFFANNGTSTVRSIETEIFGDVNVDGDAFLDSSITLWGSGVIDLPQIGDNLLLGNSDDELHLLGGEATGEGKLTTSAPLFADEGNTTISVRQFDWDGFNDDAPTTIADGATLTVDVDSYVDDHDGVITVEQGGVLNVLPGGASWRIGGTLAVAGGRVAADDLVMQPGSTLAFSDGRLIPDSLFLEEGSTVDWTGGILSADDVIGDLVNDAGVVAPGESAGRTGVFGNYTQSDEGELDIELGGLAPFTEHDRLTSSQTATLGGVLNVTLIDEFLPGLGDEFTIVSASSNIVGEFDVANFPTLPGLEWAIEYNADGVVLTVVTGVAGDSDGDEDVDGKDFLDFQTGDPSLLAEWEANFGVVGGTATAAAVPEPPTMAVMTWVLFLSAASRRTTWRETALSFGD